MTEPIHLLVMLEEQIIFPFLVISHHTNLRVISLSQKKKNQSEKTNKVYIYLHNWMKISAGYKPGIANEQTANDLMLLLWEN